jgi:hypothetical protein
MLCVSPKSDPINCNCVEMVEENNKSWFVL